VNDIPGLFGAGFNDMVGAYCLIAAAIVMFDRRFRTGRIPQPGPAT